MPGSPSRSSVAPVLLVLLSVTAPAAQPPDGLVLLDTARQEEFRPAAELMAKAREEPIRTANLADRAEVEAAVLAARPRNLIVVAPPERIDQDLARDLIVLSTRLDPDPFPDLAFAFVTGRDGLAARAFASRAAGAGLRRSGGRAGFFASWEGRVLPPSGLMPSAFAALGFRDVVERFIPVSADDGERQRLAQEALRALRGRDVLLFMSHGYPHEMSGCFRGRELREWAADLSPAVLLTSACWNGAPGRWYEPHPKGARDRGVIDPGESVALALLDSGVSALVAGVDAWHGPLTMQALGHLAGSGLSLGDMQRRLVDRLVLATLPDHLAFPRGSAYAMRGEGSANRRQNGSAMIVYGDPTFRPFRRDAADQAFIDVRRAEDGIFSVRMGTAPLIDGPPGNDFLLAIYRLSDYYSITTADVRLAACEIHRRLAWPPEWPIPALRVTSCRAGSKTLPAGEPQIVEELDANRRFLHIRVPIPVRVPASLHVRTMAKDGVEILLEGR